MSKTNKSGETKIQDDIDKLVGWSEKLQISPVANMVHLVFYEIVLTVSKSFVDADSKYEGSPTKYVDRFFLKIDKFKMAAW